MKSSFRRLNGDWAGLYGKLCITAVIPITKPFASNVLQLRSNT